MAPLHQFTEHSGQFLGFGEFHHRKNLLKAIQPAHGDKVVRLDVELRKNGIVPRADYRHDALHGIKVEAQTQGLLLLSGQV